MATEEDIWIESDGKRVIFTTKTSDGTTTVTVPELTVVHRAIVSVRDGRYNITPLSGGISGNAIAIQVVDTTSGVATSGLPISGGLIDIIAAGA